MQTVTARSAVSQSTHEMRTMRRRFVVVLYLLVAIWGVLQQFPDATFEQFTCSLVMACSATTWLALDARLRGYFIPNVVYYLIIVTWPVALPIYLMYALGWRGVGWAVLHAVGLLVALSLTYYPTYIVLGHR